MHVRISKYNPKNRNEKGHYLLDEWTAVSDIGRYQNFTVNDYLKIENNYWEVLKSILQSLKLCKATISGIEYHDNSLAKFKDAAWYPLHLESILTFKKLNIIEGTIVQFNDFESLIKMQMRETVWFAMDLKYNSYIRIGYDYYLNFGSEKNFSWVDKEGIFVEEREDTYLML